MVTIYIIITCIVITWYLLNRKPISIVSDALPGPKGYPIIGNIDILVGKPHKLFKKLTQLFPKYERMTALWFGPKLHLFVYNADDIEKILHDENSSLTKSVEYNYLKPWLGNGLITKIVADGKYRRHKKIIRPFFSTAYLLNTLPVFHKNARMFVEDLKEYVDKGEFNISPTLSLFSISNILETSLGIRYDNMNETMLYYINNIEKLGNVAHQRHYKYWLRPDWLFYFSSLKKEQDKCLEVVKPITLDIISERQRLIQENKVSGNLDETECFVDNMLLAKDEFGNKLTLEEIRDEVMTVMFAGQDTTTATIGFVLSLLGIHLDVQDRLIKEIDGIVQDSEDTFNLTQETLKKFVYLEQVLKETWRLYPPVPVVGRTANKTIKLDEYVIPKDCTIGILIMILHRNAAYFKHPHKFNPENFNVENSKNRHPYCFIPFSAGSRACIGRHYSPMLVKIVLIHFFRKYKVTSSRPESSFRLSGQITLKRKEGFLISLHQR